VTKSRAERADRRKSFLTWAGAVAALGACVLGVLLFWGAWDGTQVAAPFTRVGGSSQVETALEVSRFWLTPPQYVVVTRTGTDSVMMAAARCAVIHDAPLLFSSPDPKRRRRIQAMINDWRKIEAPNGSALPDVRARPSPELINLRKTKATVANCQHDSNMPRVARLSELKVASPLIQLRGVHPRRTLAPVVVFAAAIEPGHAPDVAVGLALAAHMAKADGDSVSLVVVPHYLESDPGLESNLEGQHELVTGGVVLGETPTVPEATATLLRQLLAARDGHGVLAQAQAELGSVGTLIGALLAFFGLTTAAGLGAPIVIERLERIEGKPLQVLSDAVKRIRGSVSKSPRKIAKGLGIVRRSYWLDNLGEKPEVTIRLRSGREVSGIIEDQIPSNARDATIFRIKAPAPPGSASPPGPKEKYVLVSVKEIESIDVIDPGPDAAKPSTTPR
jgi:hypothetical protein